MRKGYTHDSIARLAAAGRRTNPCIKCGSTEFYTKNTCATNRACKPCSRATSARYARSHPQLYRDLAKRWKSNNKEKIRESNKRSRKRLSLQPEKLLAIRLRRYPGFTLEKFKAMLDTQNGLCAICSKTQKPRLCVDHNHSTGVVRGLLCVKCNAGLGIFRDDPALMLRAIEYLQKRL